MESSQRIKTVADAKRDFISQMPIKVKNRILERLPTRDAAKISLFSTHWNDIWLRHERLAFDSDFFHCGDLPIFKCFPIFRGAKFLDFLNLINCIIFLRAEPVKKFTLRIACILDSKPLHSYLVGWCRFLSRNSVQEFNLDVFRLYGFKLPSCIVLCRTIKKLILSSQRMVVDLPINAPSIFPCVTTLVFKFVEFRDNGKGIVYNITNLEKLTLSFCNGIKNFDFNALKFESLSSLPACMSEYQVIGMRWFALHFKEIKFRCLWLNRNVEVAAPTFPTAMNLQVMKLHNLNFGCVNRLAVAMQLLKKSPNICELEIMTSNKPCSYDDIKDASRLLEDPSSCSISEDLKMLKTIKIESFSGSTAQLFFVKMLLLKSRELERVVIQEFDNIDASMVVKIQRELLRFPRASPNAQIVFMPWETCGYRIGYR